MDVSYLYQQLEEISEKVHNAWMQKKASQGFHSPENCPIIDGTDDSRTTYSKFTRRCGKCHADMYPYQELPENKKEYNRITVKAVLKAIEEL